jgi:SAM-dependent methyltransferase
MMDPAQNAAFRDAGRDDGVLAFLYLYNALQITSLVCPGETVLDLACGPANQLAMVARLNPEARFVGLDASPNMLEEGRSTLSRCGISNAELLAGDMTDLTPFDNATIDCVVCTMSLHHLADSDALEKVTREARRVLKPAGGLYMLDFGRLKRRATQRYFSQDWRDEQSPEFTQDYLHSLQAAFSIDELTNAARVLGPGIEQFATPLAPFIVIFRSRARRALSAKTQQAARDLYARLGPAQMRKFQAFARWLRMAGCHLPMSLASCVPKQ